MFYFCAFSVIGHWLEIAYCQFMRLFGIYDPDSLVWGNPFYPFMVYGIGTLVCALALTPYKDYLIEHRKSLNAAAGEFFGTAVLVCMVMELVMGLMLNQPDAVGVYPLWDNSNLPLNILGQAWLVNDIVLGAVATLYTWFFYPLFEGLLRHVSPRTLDKACVIVVIVFVALCIWTF